MFGVLENRNVSKQPPMNTPDENRPNPQAPRRVDVPDECVREEFEWVDDPDAEEEPDGYGYGV
jgi:hypothetical protein